MSQRLSELSVDEYFKSAFVSMRIESRANRMLRERKQISTSFVHLESADPRLETYLYPCFRKMHIPVRILVWMDGAEARRKATPLKPINRIRKARLRARTLESSRGK